MFGPGDSADELFMACAYAAYVEQVAAGRALLDVPLLVNAWLDGGSVAASLSDVAGGRRTGVYPSGGPVIRVAAIWREFAPTIDLLCPDFYFGDVRAVCERYAQASSGLFIPEMHRTADGVAQMFLTVGEFGAAGVSPFGADSLLPGTPDHGRLADANAMFRIAHQLLRERSEAQRRGFTVSLAAPDGKVGIRSAQELHWNGHQMLPADV